MTALLEVRNLAMQFGGLRAIDDLSFTAHAGQITALIGPNGAGKTTAFNCVTGFYRPTGGQIVLHGAQGGAHGDWMLHRMPGHRIARQARVARTFQNIRLFPGMTVLENLLVAQHNRLMPDLARGVLQMAGFGGIRAAQAAALERARHWLDAVALLARADDLAGDLPYGAQRRLEIARAMCAAPVLLCLDEPAAGLNPRESEELSTLLLRIRAEGCALLLIEHDMGVVMKIADRIVVLDHGRKISEGTPAQIRQDKAVIAAYLGDGDE